MSDTSIIHASDVDDDEAQAAHERQVEQERRMGAAGESVSNRVPVDYFGVDVIHQVMLPDGVSFIEHRELNEGQRAKYLDATNREVRVQKVTQDLVTRMKPGTERHLLLESAICGWNLVRNGEPVPFSPRSLKEWLEKAPPKIVDLVEKDVRKKNPWLLAEVSIEDLEREIADMTELLEKKREEEAGKLDSSSK